MRALWLWHGPCFSVSRRQVSLRGITSSPTEGSSKSCVAHRTCAEVTVPAEGDRRARSGARTEDFSGLHTRLITTTSDRQNVTGLSLSGVISEDGL